MPLHGAPRADPLFDRFRPRLRIQGWGCQPGRRAL